MFHTEEVGGPEKRPVGEVMQTLIGRGPGVHRLYKSRPNKTSDLPEKNLNFQEFRDSLMEEGGERLAKFTQILGTDGLEHPRKVSFTGVLFLGGLLCSGWWHTPHARKRVPRFLSGAQKWHFIGFNEWGPSWDWCWDTKRSKRIKESDHFIAQIGTGNGDEADSVPVCMTGKHAKIILNRRRSWGGMTVKISGILARRKHFFDKDYTKKSDSIGEDAGGNLNFCFWIPPEYDDNAIEFLSDSDDLMYSGYLWELWVPTEWAGDYDLLPEEVFFLWVHTDFSNIEAVKFSKSVLKKKKEILISHIIEKNIDIKNPQELTLLAKSSALVDGDPKWSSPQQFDQFFLKGQHW